MCIRDSIVFPVHGSTEWPRQGPPPHLTRETLSGRRPADGADTPGGVFRPGENLALGRKTQPSPSPHRTWSVPDASSQPPLNLHIELKNPGQYYILTERDAHKNAFKGHPPGIIPEQSGCEYGKESGNSIQFKIICPGLYSRSSGSGGAGSVSYTHLTLPTILLV